MRRAALALGTLAVLAVGAGIGWWAFTSPREGMQVTALLPGPATPGRGTSLLVVTWDTVRADRVSAYGHALPTTPTLDRFAESGLLFEQFVVPQATTLPTHLSLFSGLHPEEHGVIANSRGGKRFVFPAEVRTLAQHLGDRGFVTAGFVSSTPLKRGSGAERGFQTWGQPVGRAHQRGAFTVDAALDWLGSVPAGEPFLLWVHLVDPHHPYVVPDGYDGLLGEAPDATDWARVRGIPATGRTTHILKAYDAEIRYTDDQTARLLDALAASGRDRDTVVVVAGDHGEGLGQHGTREHGGNWHEQLATVLAVWGPGVPTGRVQPLATAHDLIPTLAPLVDWPDEEALLAPMGGVDVRTAAERPILSRRSDRQVQHRGAVDTTWTVTSPTLTVLVSPTGRSAFDRLGDPHQLRPIPWGPAADALAAVLDERRAAWGARAAGLGAGAEAELDPTTRAELEALGYVE